MKPFPVARDEICRRVDGVKNYSTDLHLDVSLPSIDRLSTEDRARWFAWQRVRSSHPARAQHRCAMVACLAGALFIGVGLAFRSGNSAVSYALMVTAAVTAAACLAATVLEGELARQPGYLRWSVRTRLDREVRQRVDLQPLRSSLDNERECGDTAYEARLVIVATEIANSIRYSPLWRSDYLDSEHCRYDLRGELAALSRHAVDLHHHRTSRDDRRRYGDELDHQPAWSTLIVRVTLLYLYQMQLDRLARQAGLVGRRAGSLTGDSSTSRKIVDELRWVITVLHETGMPTDQCCRTTGGPRYRT
jgi:hypothetical protein